MTNQIQENTQSQSGVNVVLEIESPDIERPVVPFWDVILLNDDGTPFGFVIDLLTMVFMYTESAAEILAGDIHKNGEGTVGTFFKEAAETHQAKVHDLARAEGYPLRCVLRPASKPPAALIGSGGSE